MINKTRPYLLDDLMAKSGKDNPLQYRGGFQNIQQRLDTGRRIFQSAQKDDRYIDSDSYNQDITAVVPAAGYHPVYLITRGRNILNASYKYDNPMLPPSQLMKRPKYVIDARIEPQVEEMFQESIAPNIPLIQSESIVLDQLRTAAGIRPRLLQLPMVDRQADRVFNTLQTQAEYIKASIAGRRQVNTDAVNLKVQQAQGASAKMPTEPLPLQEESKQQEEQKANPFENSSLPEYIDQFELPPSLRPDIQRVMKTLSGYTNQLSTVRGMDLTQRFKQAEIAAADSSFVPFVFSTLVTTYPQQYSDILKRGINRISLDEMKKVIQAAGDLQMHGIEQPILNYLTELTTQTIVQGHNSKRYSGMFKRLLYMVPAGLAAYLLATVPVAAGQNITELSAALGKNTTTRTLLLDMGRQDYLNYSGQSGVEGQPYADLSFQEQEEIRTQLALNGKMTLGVAVDKVNGTVPEDDPNIIEQVQEIQEASGDKSASSELAVSMAMAQEKGISAPATNGLFSNGTISDSLFSEDLTFLLADIDNTSMDFVRRVALFKGVDLQRCERAALTLSHMRGESNEDIPKIVNSNQLAQYIEHKRPGFWERYKHYTASFMAFQKVGADPSSHGNLVNQAEQFEMFMNTKGISLYNAFLAMFKKIDNAQIEDHVDENGIPTSENTNIGINTANAFIRLKGGNPDVNRKLVRQLQGYVGKSLSKFSYNDAKNAPAILEQLAAENMDEMNLRSKVFAYVLSTTFAGDAALFTGEVAKIARTAVTGGDISGTLAKSKVHFENFLQTKDKQVQEYLTTFAVNASRDQFLKFEQQFQGTRFYEASQVIRKQIDKLAGTYGSFHTYGVLTAGFIAGIFFAWEMLKGANKKLYEKTGLDMSLMGVPFAKMLKLEVAGIYAAVKGLAMVVEKLGSNKGNQAIDFIYGKLTSLSQVANKDYLYKMVEAASMMMVKFREALMKKDQIDEDPIPVPVDEVQDVTDEATAPANVKAAGEAYASEIATINEMSEILTSTIKDLTGATDQQIAQALEEATPEIKGSLPEVQYPVAPSGDRDFTYTSLQSQGAVPQGEVVHSNTDPVSTPAAAIAAEEPQVALGKRTFSAANRTAYDLQSQLGRVSIIDHPKISDQKKLEIITEYRDKAASDPNLDEPRRKRMIKKFNKQIEQLNNLLLD